MSNFYYRLKSNKVQKFLVLIIVCFLGALIPVLNTTQLAFGTGQVNVIGLNHKTVVNGIVEENNTALGYIAIYNPDGQQYGQEKIIQIYNYLSLEKVKVLKNHKTANLDDVEEGDTVFLELDQDGYVVSISAVSNHVVRYGTIVHKSLLTITVKYDGKEHQVFRVNSQVNVIHKGRKSNLYQLKNGDNVKLLIQEKPLGDVLKEIVIIDDVANGSLSVYKGRINGIDGLSRKFFAANLLLFKNGRWERAGFKGIAGLKLSEDFNIFYNDQEVDISDVNRYFRNNEAYIVVKETDGGQEQVVEALLRDELDTEIIYNDSIIKTTPGAGSFSLAGDLRNIVYTDESIIIKDQRLVNGLSLGEEDRVYVVANRNSDGRYKASLVQVHSGDSALPQIYRGRIKSIREFNSFTVESYSVLEDFSWKFYNTPKTFNITFDTRILDDNGLTGQEDLTPYGEDSFIGKVVYIIADGVNANLISTAPYGSYNFKGEVYQLTGGTIGLEGSILEEPDEINVVNVKLYDEEKRIWVEPNIKEADISILDNSIIIKDGNIIKPSQLEKGDMIRFIKRDKSSEGDAYIIIVERG